MRSIQFNNTSMPKKQNTHKRRIEIGEWAHSTTNLDMASVVRPPGFEPGSSAIISTALNGRPMSSPDFPTSAVLHWFLDYGRICETWLRQRNGSLSLWEVTLCETNEWLCPYPFPSAYTCSVRATVISSLIAVCGIGRGNLLWQPWNCLRIPSNLKEGVRKVMKGGGIR